MTNAYLYYFKDNERYIGGTKEHHYNTLSFYTKTLYDNGFISKWKFKRIIKKIERVRKDAN